MTETIWFNVLQFLGGFLLLTGGAEFLVRGASRLAARFNISSVVIGLTVVAFGTSLPELLVTLLANFRDGGSNIAIGNIVGSNIANLGLILGLAGLMAAIPVERHLLRREFPILLAVSAIFTAMAWDGGINRVEGITLFAGVVVFTYYSYSAGRGTPAEEEHTLDVVDTIDDRITRPSEQPLFDLMLVVFGVVGLVLGAHWLVNSSVFIARVMGVSELVVGLTLVAVGTSLPELATTVVAVLRKEGDIAVGNAVGSNIFNMLLIGGLSSAIRPLSAPIHMRTLDFPVMLGITVLTYLLALSKPHQLSRWQGALLLLIYAGYVGWLLFANGQ